VPPFSTPKGLGYRQQPSFSRGVDLTAPARVYQKDKEWSMRFIRFFALLVLMAALLRGSPLRGNGNGGWEGGNGDGSASPDEATAIRELEKVGLEVSRDERMAGKPVRWVHPRFPRPDDFRGARRPEAKDFTDDSLIYLRAFPHLQHLDLAGKNITDAGLRYVAKLPELRSLNVAYTKTTDAGLQALAKLKLLRGLIVVGTNVSAAGREKLQRALPRLVFETEWEHQTGVVIPPTVIP
jgi:hypothetical protein